MNFIFNITTPAVLTEEPLLCQSLHSASESAESALNGSQQTSNSLLTTAILNHFYAQRGNLMPVARNMVTTAFELDNFRTTGNLGIVRGITVRSRSIIGTIGASLQTLVGGNITLLTNLCERAREEAFEIMLQHATQLGANAVIGARYDATEMMQGVTE